MYIGWEGNRLRYSYSDKSIPEKNPDEDIIIYIPPPHIKTVDKIAEAKFEGNNINITMISGDKYVLYYANETRRTILKKVEVLQEFRCKKCGKLLGKVDGKAEIKCPRCKTMNRTVIKYHYTEPKPWTEGEPFEIAPPLTKDLVINDILKPDKTLKEFYGENMVKEILKLTK